ncbi:hypothetical protein Tco_1552395, partial [Tanacetum coccineum]
SGVIIEDWVSDDDEDIFQFEDSQTTVNPSFKKIEFTKARNEPVKSDKQAVKPRMVTQSPKRMPKESVLGKGTGHRKVRPIWNNTEKRMPKESILGKGTGHRKVRPIWNNTQRINHQNKFVPTTVLTRSGRIPVSTTKQVSKVKVNTVKVNGVNTARQTAVCTVKGNWVTAVKASTGNKALLTDYQDIDRGFVAFGGSTRGGKITGIGKIRTKDEYGEDVDVHLYKSMIGSLMYLTSSRPDIMFSICACLRFQVQPKVSHLNAVKRIFRYLKG